MSVAVRFAPSPTGNLHLGNARVAVLNWLFARKRGGTFLLRLDDTDASRSKQEYSDNLYADLTWLGLDYDAFARQSDRMARYQEIQKKLIESGRLYPCYETNEELEQKRRIQLARKAPPLYDRSALTATQKNIETWEKEGRRPYWRFKLAEGLVAWTDLSKGPLSFDICHSVSDPVLIKEDGTFLYTLSSVVDDGDFHISHIIRGEDHVTNTAVQIQIFEEINGGPVDLTFAHLALLSDAEGNPLSKREQSFSLKNLREGGMEPMAINCFLASLGSSVAPYITHDLSELAQHFDLEKIRGGARIDEKALNTMNKKILRRLPFEKAREHYPYSLQAMTPAEWEVVREIVNDVKDIDVWQNIFHGTLAPQVLPKEDCPYISAVLEWMQHHEVDKETWDCLSAYVQENLKRSGLRMAGPLRMALTGQASGPEMERLLPLLGKDRILARLGAVLPG
ncbi:glutamate--tRNA ligase 1 [Alphaproteobacteria bacterium]|nr:glutamate--tRNA ligase 1 [Alphaproteobacteria bacterium]GHS98929.1 glutamate--tRNA ligase 1 [Alphaproteobacteria bacterium]